MYQNHFQVRTNTILIHFINLDVEVILILKKSVEILNSMRNILNFQRILDYDDHGIDGYNSHDKFVGNLLTSMIWEIYLFIS